MKRVAALEYVENSPLTLPVKNALAVFPFTGSLALGQTISLKPYATSHTPQTTRHKPHPQNTAARQYATQRYVQLLKEKRT